MLKANPKLQIGAAILLMLTGCGGNGDSGSSSTSLTNTKENTGAALSSSNNQYDTTPGPTLSADLLATVLADTTTVGGRYSREPVYVWARPSSGPMPGGTPIANPNVPALSVDQSTTDPAYIHAGMPGPKIFELGAVVWDSSQRAAFALNELRLAVSLSGAKEDVAAQVSAPAGTELLRIDPMMRASSPINAHTVEDRVTHTLTAARPLVLRKGEDVPLYRVLQHWESHENGYQFAQLMVLDGEADNQFRVCLNAHALNAKRLTCSIWNVPEGWKIGDKLEFKGYYVVDDRSVYGETQPGLLYWRTAGEAPQQVADAPISAQGISGGVLATMIDSWGFTGLSPDRALPQRYASAVDAAGNRVQPDSTQAAAVMSHYDIDAIDSEVDPDVYQPLDGAVYSTLVSSRYTGSSSAADPDDPMFKRLKLGFSMTNSYLGKDSPAKSVSNYVAVAIGSADEDDEENVIPLHATNHRNYGIDRLVPFGTLNQWQTRFGDNSNVVTMEVLPGKQPDEAKLCWKVALTELQRTVCTSYRIPANWQLGQQLQVVGQHVEAPGPQYWGTGSF